MTHATPHHTTPGGRVRAQALALLASLEESTGAGPAKGEEEALAAAMAALSLAAAQQAGAGSGPAPAKAKGKKCGSGSGSSKALHRTLLERLGDLDGGREGEGFGIARVPPTGLAPVRAKPPLFDIAYNAIEERLPDLAEKAGLAPTKAKKGAIGGGGLFGWFRG